MELSPERLLAQVASEPLRPVYLVAGPEILRVLETADAIRQQARAEGVGEREVFEVEGRDTASVWAQLDASLHAPSLFSARRLIEIRMPTGKPGKDGAELIGAFCADPVPDVVLLVTADDWSRQHGGKWSEAIARAGHIAIAWQIKPHELPEWIERRLRARGISAQRDAVQRLAERVEGNLLAAAQEIDKLALLDDGSVLDLARMDALVADAARFDVFRLVDAAMNGQGAHAARMLAGMRAEGVAVPALLGMIVMELQRANALAQVQARGSNLGAEFKAQRIWESKQAAYRRALGRHDVARWQAFLVQLGRIDRASKGRGPGDPWQQLERLLLAVADASAARVLGQ